MSGAGSVTLFVPPSLSGVSRPTLLHDGSMPPVAELVDMESAESFADSMSEEPTGEVIASATAGGGLISLPPAHSAPALDLSLEIKFS